MGGPEQVPRYPRRREAVLPIRLAGLLVLGLALPACAATWTRAIAVLLDSTLVPEGATGYLGSLLIALGEWFPEQLGSVRSWGCTAGVAIGLFLALSRGRAFGWLLRRIPA